MAQALHTISAEVTYFDIDNPTIEGDIKEEVEVEFYIEPRDPDVGIMSEGADLQRVIAYREGKEIDILDNLSPSAREKLEQQAINHIQQDQADDDY